MRYRPSVADRVDPALLEEVRALVDAYRVSCLWFLQVDYYPETEAEIIGVLGAIERHGDVAAYRQAARLRAWLSQSSSAPSAGS